MQAITVAYKGPTASHGSHWFVKCAAGSRKVPYDHALDTEGNVAEAVKALCSQLGWTWEQGYRGAWTTGQIHNGTWVACYSDVYESNRFVVER